MTRFKVTWQSLPITAPMIELSNTETLNISIFLCRILGTVSYVIIAPKEEDSPYLTVCLLAKLHKTTR